MSSFKQEALANYGHSECFKNEKLALLPSSIIQQAIAWPGKDPNLSCHLQMVLLVLIL
jgi:hypothetical protein